MKRAFIFPGQGAQFSGMGKDLYDTNPAARTVMDRADSLLGFKLTEIMFHGSPEDLKSTLVTQPAIFLHSVTLAGCSNLPHPDMVGGHSLGEFSALVAAGAVSFEDGLQLVTARARAMQECCEAVPGSMAAVIGLDVLTIEQICAATRGTVVPANYNSDAQIVISGEAEAVAEACKAMKAAGAKRALPLPVSGAFHSPLMEPARKELARAIARTSFRKPSCPVYQNVSASPETDPDIIKENLICQLTAPVRWTASVRRMLDDGASSFTEIGPGSVLQGLVRRIAGAESPILIEGIQ